MARRVEVEVMRPAKAVILAGLILKELSRKYLKEIVKKKIGSKKVVSPNNLMRKSDV